MALRRERHPRHRSQFVREEAAAGLHESRVIRRNRRRARRWFDGWRRVGGGWEVRVHGSRGVDREERVVGL
jgi:hypothetical protein